MPAWRLVDPLPVLEYLNDDEDEEADRETLDSMLGEEKPEMSNVTN
jgi:hypothetical protein